MNLISQLQRLDKLILERAPISEQRALINSMIETAEAHDQETADHAALKIAHAKLQDEHTKLKTPKRTPDIKIVVKGPYNPTYGVKG